MDIPIPRLEEAFRVEVKVDPPVVVGQDDKHGRRQLIAITEGVVSGKLNGKVLPCGVDSQIIRPDGFTELVARYGLLLDDGESVYINNSGIRRVDPSVAAEVAGGKIVDPKYVYFVTVPTFETYSPKYAWLEKSVFICSAIRLPDKVLLRFYEVK
jgi:hypothetical protein